MPAFIYLASQSPRRQDLLRQMGVEFRVLVPDSGEDLEALELVSTGESATTYVQRVTQLKLKAALLRLRRQELEQAPILCADTTVAMGRRILGKPQDTDEAESFLAALSDKTHQVLTAVSVGTPKKAVHALNISRVTFGPITPVEVASYVASQEYMGKAGGYAIQGRAAAWIRHISGSYSGIMGLPLYETSQLLSAHGIR